MMPEPAMWRRATYGDPMDFSLNGAQGGVSFRERIEKSYGRRRQRRGNGLRSPNS